MVLGLEGKMYWRVSIWPPPQAEPGWEVDTGTGAGPEWRAFELLGLEEGGEVVEQTPVLPVVREEGAAAAREPREQLTVA